MQFLHGQDLQEWSQKEFQILRCMLLTTAYHQTISQLQLFQRGQRLHTAHYTIVKPKCRKTSTAQQHMKIPNSKTMANTATTIRTTARPLLFAPTTRTRLSTKLENECQQRNEYECMPSEKVLNAIKLEQELDALKRIYRVAVATCPSAEPLTDNKFRDNSIQQLLAAIEAQKVNHNEDEVLQEQLLAGQATMRTLKTQLNTAEKHSTAVLYEKDEQIATLKHNLRHVKRVNELELNLVERWEDTRFTQASIVGENDERALLRQILDYKRRLAGESRIICEIESFRKGQFLDLRTQINEWQIKFKNEIKRMDINLQQQEKQMIELMKKHERHTEIYKEREQYVEEYLKKKAEEERILQQELHRVECAIRLQAWWRGTMVRRGLGPYKKKPKKGKKGKSK